MKKELRARLQALGKAGKLGKRALVRPIQMVTTLEPDTFDETSLAKEDRAQETVQAQQPEQRAL